MKDINKAVVIQVTQGLINTTFKNVKFTSTDITENLTRPSFFIDFENNKTGLMNAFNKERNVELKLFYFSKTRKNNKLELMDMQEQLENIFLKYIKVNDDFYIPINNIDFDVVKEQGYLLATIELYTLELLPEDSQNDSGSGEMIEELDIKINTNM
ncbi:phage tail terminator family protein [Clostridium magnum]|uniref:Uncharacterized protein n=1 Tax=Clostridium magnum DSM 2767 TaxID=1121326 RepID=A0A168E1K5_9CLOT|nr:hypothetical protein [Clostridium magnum]KZL93554.1 hypothetical protein CLMAG_06000 [Clostridium magnum DSM 2767]SHI60773.1 hypothetical protein SAMN02745944_04576 [Clostridium magnum DSM 2767]